MLAALLAAWQSAGLTPAVVALLLLAAGTAGFVDAIAGGGGLITVPALLAAGLPTHLMLGTNKGQSVFGSGAALASYTRAGRVSRERAPGSFLAAFVGSLAGAWLVSLLDPALLRPIVMVLLVAVALFLAVRSPLQPIERHLPPERARAIATGLALGIGAYDGFFGPGTGTFLIIGNALLLGMPLTSASADAKVVNFASNLAALCVFAWRGSVLWAVSLPMAAAQFTGGWLGAHVAVRGGDRLVRWVVLLVVVSLVCKLGFDAWESR